MDLLTRLGKGVRLNPCILTVQIPVGSAELEIVSVSLSGHKPSEQRRKKHSGIEIGDYPRGEANRNANPAINAPARGPTRYT